MNGFKSYHPSVNFIFFASVIAFSMILMHPVCLCISFASGFAYSVMLNGKNAVKFNLTVLVPMMLAAALINVMFNHEGATILAYLPDENPLTLESVFYGLAGAAVLVAVICWFSCFNAVMTSDKIIYLFGRIAPSLSLILSMTLRFVPRFKSQMKKILGSQRCIGRDVTNGSIIARAKHGITILSIMITWALENAVETADSMKSRGYGLSGRSAFSNFKLTGRDIGLIIFICAADVLMAAACMYGTAGFSYFPVTDGLNMSVYGIGAAAAYAALCVLPAVIEVREVCRWGK